MLKWTILLSILYATLTSAQHSHGGMVMNDTLPAFNATGDEPMSYSMYPENKSYLYIHVAMMVIAFWILMPIGVMLGIAKSSLHVPVQLAAFAFAMVGFSFAKVYGHTTPHLYAGNSHHTLGWILYLFLVVQMVVGVVRKIANAVARNNSYERLEENANLLSRYQRSESAGSSDRHSMASGETLHMNEIEFDKHEHQSSSISHEEEEEDDDEMLMSPEPIEPKKETVTMRLFHAVSPCIPKVIKNVFVMLAYNPFTKVVCRYYHQIMGRTFIVLIFVQTLSGLVVYHGVCRSWDVLGCIAHLIKGGIFFFYGIITFGRYLGAFAERGWAWNKMPEGREFKYSFEMIESGLIFVYGITNTWMEHFGQNAAWTHKDLEHASLAFMWWWCGLIGILVESRALRRLLERTILTTTQSEAREMNYSLNPFPALTVLMTGISMGNHHQDSAYSTNIHFMWGLLLGLAAVCRFVTYVTLYRNTPTDTQPSRPPSELVGAFLLISGSILFMASNSGTMTWLRRENVDSMFLMNVCVALTSITLCYVAGLQILKAWAERREARKQN